MNDGLRLAQLLCTRLCHDLAGPVGAVTAGVELMGSDPALIDEETLSLLAGSAEAASHKLKYLRVAFGWSGSMAPAIEDVPLLFDNYLVATSGPSGRAAASWPDGESLTALSVHLGDDAAQILANMVLLGLEAQPGCTRLDIGLDMTGDLTLTVANTGRSGRAAEMPAGLTAVIAGLPESEWSPKTVQAHLTSELVRARGGRLEAAGGETVTVTGRWARS